MSAFSLHTIAPRLARARDQYLRHQAAEVRYQRWYRNTHHELEWLVAHRELEALRAEARGRGRRRHVQSRYAKLAEAQGALARLERRNERRKAAA